MSTPHVADRLQASIDATGSLACVGLDPRTAMLPPVLVDRYAGKGDPAMQVAEAFLDFNRGILEAIAGACACVKPQLACYEAYGSAGLRAFEGTVIKARELGIPVIADGKRGDIGSTATHYRQAYLGEARDLDGEVIPGLGIDWLTVNAYLGSDGVEPFLSDPPGDGGVFVLVKTSNPGSTELQGLACEGATVMEKMAELVAGWGASRLGACGLADVGAVVGATWPDEARALRRLMPHTPFLVPGYGAQGGGAADALAGIRDEGNGVVVNSSRGIIAAWQQADDDPAGERWAEAARSALDAMNADLNANR